MATIIWYCMTADQYKNVLLNHIQTKLDIRSNSRKMRYANA